MDVIDACIGVLDNTIARIVNVIGIVAGPAAEGVSSQARPEGVVGTVAGEDVIERIASGIDRCCPG